MLELHDVRSGIGRKADQLERPVKQAVVVPSDLRNESAGVVEANAKCADIHALSSRACRAEPSRPPPCLTLPCPPCPAFALRDLPRLPRRARPSLASPGQA